MATAPPAAGSPLTTKTARKTEGRKPYGQLQRGIEALLLAGIGAIAYHGGEIQRGGGCVRAKGRAYGGAGQIINEELKRDMKKAAGQAEATVKSM